MRKEIAQAAKEGAAKYAEQELELLKKLSAIDCGTFDEEGNAKVIDTLRPVFSTLNAKVEERYVEGVGTHLIIRINPGSSKGKVMFSAHLDTVFSRGDAADNPWHVQGDWAYGLGIADCKGGVVTSLYGVKIMQEAGLLPEKEIVMIYNCDEEVGSPEGKKIFQEEAKTTDMAFVFEPARGIGGILTERKGICAYSVKITGKTAHPGISYKEGRSAVIELAHQTLALYEKNDETLGIAYNITDVEGGSKSGGIPEYAKATVTTPLGTVDAINRVREDMTTVRDHVFVDGCSNEVEEEICHPYMPPSEENRQVYHLVKKAGELLGQELPEESTAGASDANLLCGYGIPVVCGLGPYMKDIHTVKEGLLIPSLQEKTALAAALVGILDEEA